MFPSCFKMISPFAGKEVQAKIVKALSADKLVVTPGHSGVVTLLQPSVVPPFEVAEFCEAAPAGSIVKNGLGYYVIIARLRYM